MTAQGAYYRKLGWTRLEAWKAERLAAIPDKEFEAIITELYPTRNGVTLDGVLRIAKRITPPGPRPEARARDTAVSLIQRALNLSNASPEIVRTLLTEALATLKSVP
jgi:hypothetical protein